MASRSEEEGTAETMNPLDMAMSVLKASAERRVSQHTPGWATQMIHQEGQDPDVKWSKTAHPSISDERLHDAQLSEGYGYNPLTYVRRRPFADSTTDDDSYDMASRFQSETRNPAKNSLLTRIKQIPRRAAQDMQVHGARERSNEAARRARVALGMKWPDSLQDARDRGAAFGGQTLVGHTEDPAFQDFVAGMDQERNRMSWADANKQNQQALAEGAMQPVPQPPPLQQPVPQGVNQP